jgi:hypothetical protein
MTRAVAAQYGIFRYGSAKFMMLAHAGAATSVP